MGIVSPTDRSIDWTEPGIYLYNFNEFCMPFCFEARKVTYLPRGQIFFFF